MTVGSERAEQATRRANRALAYYRLLAADAPETVPYTPASDDSASYYAHDTILRLISIAEDFSFGRFVDAIEPTLPASATVSALWEAELDRSGDTWHKRNRLWRSYAHVTVPKFPRHKELEAFIQARNAVAHGLGRLTRRQARGRAKTLATLNHADLAVRGDTLLLVSADVERCASVVKAFISWLDAAY